MDPDSSRRLPARPDKAAVKAAGTALGKSTVDAGLRVGLDQIDLSRYDLDSFRDDIANIVGIRLALLNALKVVALVPFIAAVVAWLVLTIPLDGAVLGFTVFLLFVLAFPVAGLGAVAWVARRRFERTTRAAGRAVELVGLIHADVDAVRETGAEVPMRAVGALVAEEAVFPALRIGIEQWTALTGPIGFIAQPLVSATLKAIERKAVVLISELPDQPASAAPVEDLTVQDSVAAAPPTAAAVTREYDALKNKAETIVNRVGGVVTIPLLLVAAGAAIGWLLLLAVIAILG